GELVGGPGAIHAPDRVEEHHAVARHQVGACAEESFELRNADMLEHADGDDPVEAIAPRGEVAVIDQLELHPVRYAGGGSPLLRERQLFFGKGNAVDLYVGTTGEEDRHSAPAASDVEHCLARL